MNSFWLLDDEAVTWNAEVTGTVMNASGSVTGVLTESIDIIVQQFTDLKTKLEKANAENIIIDTSVVHETGETILGLRWAATRPPNEDDKDAILKAQEEQDKTPPVLASLLERAKKLLYVGGKIDLAELADILSKDDGTLTADQHTELQNIYDKSVEAKTSSDTLQTQFFKS